MDQYQYASQMGVAVASQYASLPTGPMAGIPMQVPMAAMVVPMQAEAGAAATVSSSQQAMQMQLQAQHVLYMQQMMQAQYQYQWQQQQQMAAMYEMQQHQSYEGGDENSSDLDAGNSGPCAGGENAGNRER